MSDASMQVSSMPLSSMQLFIARHGETDLNAQMRYQGSSDYPLNDVGLEQARQLAESLPGGITHLVTSPLRRARQTAEAVAGRHGLVMSTMDVFRERDYGVFEALNRQQTVDRYPELVARRIAAQWDEAPPGGETVRQAVSRVAGGLRELQARHDEARVLLVAHGFVARAVAWLLSDLDEASFYAAPMIGNAQFQHYPRVVIRPFGDGR